MAENLATRVGRLLSGTANSLVDVMENLAPEVVMEEAIREVDRAMDDVRAELGKVLSSKHLATARLADENAKHEDLGEKVRVALAENREDLAEAAMGRIMDIEAQIPVLETTIAQTKEAEAELESYIDALKARKREMQDDLKQFRASRPEEAVSGDGSGGGRVETAVSRAEQTFDRIMESASSLPGSTSPADREAASRLAELDDLARRNRVKERLAAFKASAGDGE